MFGFFHNKRCKILQCGACMCTWLMIHVLAVLFVQNVHAEDLSAEEIMAKSKTAMSQPLRYTSVSNGIETVVYRKPLPNGSIAMLTTYPATKKINIVYDKKRYDIRLEHQIAIDMSQILKSGQAQVVSDDIEPKGVSAKKIFALAEDIKYKDNDCYVVIETLSPEFKKDIWDKISERMKDQFPVKRRFVIDKGTYLTHERETFAENGVTLSKVEYRDIHPQPDLSDDFFQLPPDLEVLTPASMEEYISIVAGRLHPQRPLVDAAAVKARVKKESDERIAKIDKAFAAEIKETDEKYDKLHQESLARAKKIIEESHREHPLPQASNHRWIVVVSVNVVVIAALFILWWIRHRKNR